jgi:hypothetical protein
MEVLTAALGAAARTAFAAAMKLRRCTAGLASCWTEERRAREAVLEAIVIEWRVCE